MLSTHRLLNFSLKNYIFSDGSKLTTALMLVVHPKRFKQRTTWLKWTTAIYTRLFAGEVNLSGKNYLRQPATIRRFEQRQNVLRFDC